MKKLFVSLLIIVFSAGLLAAQQQAARKVYIFGVPKVGGTTSDEQVVVNVANGSAVMTWCNMAGNCAGGPSQVGGNAFNPQFSQLWVNIPVLVNNVANTITSCSSPTQCTLQSTVASGCSNFCTLRLTNFYQNELMNQMLASGSIFNGVATLVDWDDIDMAGSINVTNGSNAIVFNSVLQHCTNSSTCSPTTFACSSAWNGKSFKIFDSAGAVDRTVTMTDCTHLSGNYAGATNAAQLFHGLYDFTIPDGLITTYAINGHKVALLARPSASSGVNFTTPAYVTGTDYALSQVQTNTLTGCTASTTINSNLITFSGCNQINWAGTIAITGVTALVINNCVPTGIWGYTSNTCIAQANALATVSGAAFTWTPSPVEVCFTNGGYGGGLNGASINSITYAAPPSNTCQNTQLGSAPLRIAANPSGINYVPAFVYQQAWQQFITAFMAKYNANANVDYIRFGGWGGGEWFPWAQTLMQGTTPSATISDPPFTRWLIAAIDDQQNAVVQATSPTTTVDSSANNCTGAGVASDFSCADLELSDALFHGLTGFGSQGVGFSDLTFYSGFPCSGNHCRWWDYINSCQPNAPFFGCNANIKTPFLLQIQQAGESDLFNFFYGPGTANPPISAVRTNGQVVVTFTSDPTAGAGIKTDGSSAITMAGWDASFNGTFQIVNTSAGAKTITYNQPLANATSSVVGVAGESVFSSWSLVLPFEYARGTNDVELYFDDAACLVSQPLNTYHSFVCNQPYSDGVALHGSTLGAVWTNRFTAYQLNAIQ